MPHRLSVLTAALTFPLILAGATVTSTPGAPLSIPDWPLPLFPALDGPAVYEHGHRMVAGLVGISTLVLAVGVQLTEKRRWVCALAWSAFGLVLAQAVLGGLTVLLKLPTAVSALHAGIAQAFFALVTAIAFVTSPSSGPRPAAPGAPAPRGRAPGMARAGEHAWPAATAILIYAQIAVGAVVRHLGGSALAIPDFPSSFGGIIPPAEQIARPDVVVNFAHRLGALAVLAVGGVAAWRALSSGAPSLRRPALVLAALLPAQVLIGASIVWSGRAFLPAIAHVAVGALVLATAVVLAIRGHQVGQEEGRADPAVLPGDAGGIAPRAIGA